MTPTLLSAFWTYTLITALTPGPNNILALSSATSHGFRQSTRVLAGMSLGFLIVMLLCAGISFSLAVIDPAAVRLLSWAGAAYIVWLAWKIATSPTKEDGLQAKPISFWASFAVCERQNHFVRHYGAIDICPATNASIKLGRWRKCLAGDDWHVW